MKIVKLNRRFKQFRKNGHTVALRFDGWDAKVIEIESVCRARLGSGWRSVDNWYSYYGARSARFSSRPFWITFRNETDLTLVLLSCNLTN